MKKSNFFLFRKIFPFVLLCITLSAFVFHTTKAVSVVNFHADIFEKKEKFKDELVILDAGHGGEDGGATGVNGISEKDINFTITLSVKEKLEQAGFSVLLTREDDTLIGDNTLASILERKRSDTKRRLEIIKENENATFISIHQNHFSQERYHGAQIFYSGNHPDSEILAEYIRKSIVESTQPENTRQNKKAEKNIYILFHSERPAVLVECGFISNYNEAEKLAQAEYQEKIAEAIAKGVVSYFENKTTK